MENIIENKDESGIIEIVESVRRAQKIYSKYSQEEVDKIFFAAAMAANKARIELARAAVEETGRGILEDKVIKNHFAAEYVYNAYRDSKSCGIIEEDEIRGIRKIAEPIGVIAAIVPTTNPTSTAIFKILLALKTRNGIIISPHPSAALCTIRAAQIMLDAAKEAGAPEGIISWIENPTLSASAALMSASDTVLATGGPSMVRAAYSCGKPAIGVGSGNTPVIICPSADILLAVNSIIHSKVFDNGMICASEQAVIAEASIYEEIKSVFSESGVYVLDSERKELLRKFMYREDGRLNSDVVGMSAEKIAELACFEVPKGTKILMVELSDYSKNEPFAGEKLSPVLALVRTNNFEESLDAAENMLKEGGIGHTCCIYINDTEDKEKISLFEEGMMAGRILVNTPASFGAIGDIYNFALTPSLTLGCGSYGGNSVSENVGIKHLLNIKTVVFRRENTLWMRLPERVFIKSGCIDTAIKELCDMKKKRAFIVTDRYLSKSGKVDVVTKRLYDQNISFSVFSNVNPDPDTACIYLGVEEMRAFSPDVIIAFGGGSAMDAAKIMWVLYEHPDMDFSDMAVRFSDIRKRIYKFQSMGNKAYFVAIPTTAGTGSEVTPFAVITDSESGIKYPLADYELMPNMAVVDACLSVGAPKTLVAAAGIDALTHAIEAYSSMMATEFSDALALEALEEIFIYLPVSFNEGDKNLYAAERMAHAAAIAGQAFANAFLGLCHSMAHKLGAYFHLPHGIANALLITHIMRFNASSVPTRMGLFPQYKYPCMMKKFVKMAQRLGVTGDSDESAFENLILKIEKLKKEIGIKPSIQDYIADEKKFLDTLDRMSEDAFDDQCTGANPRYPLISEIKEIYIKAYYGN